MRGLLLWVLLGAGCTAAQPGVRAVAPDTGRVAVPGGALYYEAAGSGPALLLLHGGFGDRRMWNLQFEALAREFRVVCYDHRGFGRSPAADTTYSPVADLLRLLDHLAIDRAHLVGNSLGGALAIDFALQHPERVGKLVVVASGANGYPYSDDDIASVVAVFRAAQEVGLDRAVELWLEHPMVQLASQDPAVAPRLRTMVRENRGVFRMRYWPSEPLDPPAFARLGELRAPVLFIVGDRDTPLVQRVAAETAMRIPGARQGVIPGTDHLPQLEQPREFNRLVREFLRMP